MSLLSKIKTSIATAAGTYQGLGLTASFFSFFQGRATTFAIAFALEGAICIAFALWGFVHHMDLTSLGSVLGSMALLDAAIFTGVVGHSLKEDYFERRKRLDAATCDPPGQPQQ